MHDDKTILSSGNGFKFGNGKMILTVIVRSKRKVDA
jgi:hypothetical protein